MRQPRIFNAVFCVLVSILISNTVSAQSNIFHLDRSITITENWVKQKESAKQHKSRNSGNQRNPKTFTEVTNDSNPDRGRKGDKPKENESDQQVRFIKIENQQIQNAWTEETKYYEDIRMDSLWYVGVGNPISAKEAKNMDKVYRLSKKLRSGKYIHVECLDCGKQKPSEMFCSRLLPVEKYDYKIDEDSIWVESEKLISQIYQYPSIDANSKLMEIGCDKDGNVIHSASIEYAGGNQAIIIYYDPLGNIINLTDPESYMNGTIVLVEFQKTDEATYTVSDIGGWPIKKNK